MHLTGGPANLIRATALLAIFASGFYGGTIWQAHRHDAADLKAQGAQLAATQDALDTTQGNWQRALADFRADSASLNATAEEYARERESQAAFARTLDARLDAALAARPDLAGCDIGPDGLRIWNDANRGAAAASGNPVAAPGDRPGAAANVRGVAAGEIRPVAGSRKEPLGDHGALSRLRGPAPADDPRGAGATSDRGAARGRSPTELTASGADS